MTHSVIEYFLQQIAFNKNKPALVYKDQIVTYQQLDEASSHLCTRLQEKGIAPGDNVPLVTLRTPEYVIGILAICKAGASYIPVDARYPEKRILDIVQQSGSGLIVTSNSEINKHLSSTTAEIIAVDQAISGTRLRAYPAKITSSSVAYIIFTSGTTGQPKGVVIEQDALLKLILWHNEKFSMNSQCRSTLMAGTGFDVAQWEIWSALTSGATIFLPEEETRLQPAALLDFFATHQLTHAFVPTVLVADLVSLPQPEELKLRYLFTAGEKLNPVDLSLVKYTLIDYYGPTEATIFATWNKVVSASPQVQPSIGRPVTDTEIFILDEQLQPVQGELPGELFISGRCLARGYLNRPRLTAEKFITLPHLGGKRLYQSGDLARWLPDGRIQYLGRKDDQVKIRGNRVELGEIENLIMQVPGVKTAVAVATQPENPAEKKIIAFLISSTSGSHPLDEVKAHVKAMAPGWFMPADFQWREAFPLNANGKTDKAALLAEYRPGIARDRPLLTQRQEAIAAVWRDLLGLNYVAATDNFFDTGGHSLLAAALATRLSKQLGVRAYVRDIYDYPTVNELEKALAERAGQTAPRVDSEPVHLLQSDVRLADDIHISPDFDERQLTRPQTILLTGATGFVGSHLLTELLSTTRATIYCPVRSPTSEQAQRRITEVTKRYRIDISPEQSRRIRVIPADLAEPDFGMQPEAYRSLCQQIDIVYHSASSVNFIQPYSWMKRDNVQGLQHIIRFASQLRTKPLILLSTISVYSWGHLHTGKTTVLESDDIDENLPAVITDIGYVRSKWVMEKIADLAASQGLPLMTFRLGYATSHSRTGVSASYQWWGRLVQTCLSTGTVPDLHDLREGLTTVDYMTRAIAHISRNPQALGNKFNLIHEDANNLTLKAFFEQLENHFDLHFRLMPFTAWLAQWEQDTRAPLYPLLSLFKDNMVAGQSTVQLYQNTYRWDCRNVKEFLTGSGIEEPRFTKEVLLNYLRNSLDYDPQPKGDSRHTV
jgi:amino acid adenylation domain-containing protein/thioester reductase-like protein